MNSNSRATSIAGVLALAGMIAGALSVVPVLEQADYLALIPAHQRQVLLGAGAQLLMVLLEHSGAEQGRTRFS